MDTGRHHVPAHLARAFIARAWARSAPGIWLAVTAACGPSARGDADAGGGATLDAGPSDARTADRDARTGERCGVLAATIRDFHQTHPDFESFEGSAAFPGLVEADLGADDNPVYAPAGATAQTSGPDEFAGWYDDVPGINSSVPISIALTETAPGVFVYDNQAFFPVDGMGFGDEGNPHNFHFTTEIHTEFPYRGGEVFTFRGDDDLWMFINRRLAIDLGGLHPALAATIDLDGAAAELGISPGQTVRIDIFHADRHTPESTFRIETTIDCFVVE